MRLSKFKFPKWKLRSHRRRPQRQYRIGIELLEQRYLLATGSFSVIGAEVLKGDPQNLVEINSAWRYLDDGSDQGTEWRQAGFDDATWPTGNAKLGYGDGDVATTVSFGGDPNNVFATTYFRHEFNVLDSDIVDQLGLSVIRDDGVAVYLNGVEILRDGLLPDATFDQLATQQVIDEAESIPVTADIHLNSLPAETVISGINVLASEIHQAGANSTDIGFDLTMNVNQNAKEIVLDVSGSFEVATVQPTDLVIDGTLTATSVELLDADTLVFGLPDLDDGAHTAAIQAGDIEDQLQNGIQAFSFPFLLGPSDSQYVVHHAPRIQLGDAPLIGFPGSEFDQIEIIWQTIPSGAGIADEFLVDYRPNGTNESWITVPLQPEIDTGYEGRVNHSALIGALDFDANYEYRVRHLRSGVRIGDYQDTFHTRHAPSDSDPFSFAAYGDSAGLDTVQNFRNVQSRINAIDPAFALLLGDNVYEDGTHTELDVRFDPILNPEAAAWIASHVDFYSAGNHDVATAGGQPSRDNFSVPVPIAGVTAPVEPLASEPPEHNYSFDYGTVHFVTFDTNSLYDAVRLDEQLNWVEADLAASTAQWNVVFAHHPVAGAPDKPESPSDNYYQQVVARLHAAGVDLFLVGHSHTYSWTYPLTGEFAGQATFVQDTNNEFIKGAGLVQVISGAGGRSLRSGSFDEFPFVASGFTTDTTPELEDGFAKVDVTPDELVVSYIAADDGAVIDSFSISSDLTIGIQAAGKTGEEAMELQIDGVPVASWSNVGGNYAAGQFQYFEYSHPGYVASDQVRVVFTNDGTTATGEDKNLRVDGVTIDGVKFESESPQTFSTGSWISGTGCASGALQSEFLHCGGYLQYSSGTGSTIHVLAAGKSGMERMELQIAGATVAAWDDIGGDYDSGVFETYTFDAPTAIAIEQIRVVFSNDGTTAAGEPKDLRIDGVILDGAKFESEAPEVISTGTWVSGSGCTSGQLQSEFLHCGGYLQFGANAGATIDVLAAGATGEEQLELEVDGVSVATWINVGGNYAGGEFQTFTHTLPSTTAPNQIRIHFANDGTTATGNDKNLQVDSILVNGARIEIEEPSVLSTGTWISGVGCTSGNLQSEYLHCGGYFEVTIPTENWSGSGSTKTTVRKFTVNSLDDISDAIIGDGVAEDVSGKTTLRAALEEANALFNLPGGPDQILFDINGAGPHTITPGSALAAITDTVIIDGTSEPDFSGVPVVEIDGSLAGAGANGLQLAGAGSAGSSIKGLALNNFTSAAIRIVDAGGHTITGNVIGLDVDGVTAAGNLFGLHVSTANNTIGGSGAGEGNVISENNRGILLNGAGAEASGNVVRGNIIGMNAGGNASRGNNTDGVKIRGASGNMIGGPAAADGNTISTNGTGVSIQLGGAGNTVENNLIGTMSTGEGPRGNQTGIKVIGAPATIIRSNVVADSDRQGIRLTKSSTTGTRIENNLIGTDATGTQELGNRNDGVLIARAPGNMVIGNLIANSGFHGIRLLNSTTTDTIVQGNLIGTDINGTTAMGNGMSGIYIKDSPNNQIGGTGAQEGNTIAASGEQGIFIERTNAHGNTIEGNNIGTNSAGTAALGNASHGIQVSDGSNIRIGGTAAGAGNVIGGGLTSGVVITGGTVTVEGNFIGTDRTVTLNLGNNSDGIHVNGGVAIVGGTVAGAGNTIANNSNNGVKINSGTRNPIQGNSIFDNGLLGIDLKPTNGPTVNDIPAGSEDADAGANNLQNFPNMTAAIINGANLNITYSVPTIVANSEFPLTVEFFLADVSGTQGATPLGTHTYAAPGIVTAQDIPASGAIAGTVIVATATDANGNTSEFSAAVNVALPLLVAVSPESRVQSQERAPALTDAQLSQVSGIAIARLRQLGLGADLFANVSYAIADLPGATLGLAGGNKITIDTDAAGHGWSLNPQSEIRNSKSIDLLSVVMHELGHVAGLEDLYDESEEGDLMYAWLKPGVRSSSVGAALVDRAFSDVGLFDRRYAP
jgi:hypothetical protein